MDSVYTPSFDDVLVAARNGDGPAFDQLFRALNRRVASFAKARRADDPEGLVNDVFVRVFRSLPTFSGNEAQFNGWVFRIARNLLVDQSRAHARRVPEAENDDLIDRPTSEPGPDETAVHRVDGEALLCQLDVLTPEQRDVVLLRVVADQSLETVAASLGKSVGSVKAMQRRALRKLAREISREAVSP